MRSGQFGSFEDTERDYVSISFNEPEYSALSFPVPHTDDERHHHYHHPDFQDSFFADSLKIAGQVYHNVYFNRNGTAGDTVFAYTISEGIVAFKRSGSWFVLQ